MSKDITEDQPVTEMLSPCLPRIFSATAVGDVETVANCVVRRDCVLPNVVDDLVDIVGETVLTEEKTSETGNDLGDVVAETVVTVDDPSETGLIKNTRI